MPAAKPAATPALTPSTKPQKPPKPYPVFPLYAHAAGVWAKKVRGKSVRSVFKYAIESGLIDKPVRFGSGFTDCQWRYLPGDFPPKSTGWGYFNEWRQGGTPEATYDRLRDRVRKEERPGKPRRTASIDSRSVDTSSGGQARGRHNAKQGSQAPQLGIVEPGVMTQDRPHFNRTKSTECTHAGPE